VTQSDDPPFPELLYIVFLCFNKTATGRDDTLSQLQADHKELSDEKGDSQKKNSACYTGTTCSRKRCLSFQAIETGKTWTEIFVLFLSALSSKMIQVHQLIGPKYAMNIINS